MASLGGNLNHVVNQSTARLWRSTGVPESVLDHEYCKSDDVHRLQLECMLHSTATNHSYVRRMYVTKGCFLCEKCHQHASDCLCTPNHNVYL